MSKKNLVKKVIDNLIQDGVDFADLTQSALVNVDGLQGVSKTTIKRAKKEYKQEKLANQQDFKEQNIKRKIYKFLDRRPKSSLADLREALPGIQPSKVSEYHLFWKKKQEKTQQKTTEKKNRVSPRKLKEMIFNYLDTNNGSSTEDLYLKFPDAKQNSINSYLAGWKRKLKNTEKAVRGGLYEVIFKFLDQKPEATIEDTKAAFSDVPQKSIEIYHNLWLKEREESKANVVSLDDVVQEFIETGVSENLSAGSGVGRQALSQSKKGKADTIQKGTRRRGRPPLAATIKQEASLFGVCSLSTETEGVTQKSTAGSGKISSNDADLIQTMKRTIEAHNTTIFELEKEYRLLMERQSAVIKEMEAMSSDQIVEIRDFILTYFKGLQNN